MFHVLAGCSAAGECGEPLDPEDPGFPYTGAIPSFELTLTAEARAGLPTIPRDAGEDVPATFSSEGTSWEVGLDLKGNTSFRDIDGKPSFKIDFAEFVDASFHGVRRLTLDNMVSDETQLAAHLAFQLYAAVGVPAPRQGFACVSVDGEDYGLYSMVETMDEQFLDRAFVDGDGALFDRRGDADLASDATRFFEAEEGVDEEDWAALRSLADELVEAPEILPFFDAHFDRDALLRELAVEIAIGSVDGYALNANNFLLYREPPDRWWLLPWGIDQAFRPPAGEVVTEAERPGILARRCLEEEACRAALAEELLVVADAMEGLDPRGAARRIKAITRRDPRTETSDFDRWGAWQDLYGFVERRPAALREW